MAVAERLAELGIELPPVAAPAGSYQPAVRSGEHVWTSGQLPVVDGQMASTGQVGEGPGLVSPDEANRLARTCAVNALAAVASVADLDQVEQVVKVVGFVSSDPGFTGQPGVVNGASDLLAEVFGDSGRHARSAVGVAVLPLGASVEVELVVRLRAA
ncbi:RidA family protein [Marihabitans asiaticum]|uniref:Enamine deaminase RidA (YjgF/YER057c/UK114 family) n=1 Tax=Marihabitans asiaticum TaxID=415218 RepID=A0A560WDR8_9MICO|nr:RidA family protein [Marihabitans asiaticum]TWD15746.1 enamine deaminase RidA (YjgF/YER057c/UK114 family) [Marihabitans asiaticum]